MKNLTLTLIAFIVAAFTSVEAQPSNPLIGKWETTYDLEGEKIHVSYQFKKNKEKLLCHTLFLKDETGQGEAYDSVVMTDVHLKNNKGTALYKFKYEGEIYEVKASLYLRDANTLEVSYSYYGYDDTEIWKKI